MPGLYIHVPFCSKRCIYCDFYSTTLGRDLRQQYTDALCREIKLYRGEELSTIYFGGGTPSQLTFLQLSQIFETIHHNFSLMSDAEITMEANPDDVTQEFIVELARLGVNRVSLGIQTFNDEHLKFLNRRHSAQEAIQAVERIDSVGIKNISVDLIYGLPNETLEEWREDVRQALSLPITHLSSYCLMIEEGTVLFKLWEKGQVKEVEEEMELSMFQTLIEMTEREGFEHYEISNFARAGFHSQHNSRYWQGLPYIGCGPGAHGFDGHTRRSNNADLRAYIAEPGLPPYSVENLTEEERFEELVFTRMRMMQGLNLQEVPSDKRQQLLLRAKPFIDKGNLECVNNHLRLTRSGIFISDYIFSNLI